MRRKKLLLTAAGVAGFAVLSFAILGVIWSHRHNSTHVNLTDQQAKEMLDQEVPPGTVRAQLKQFLDRRGWPHSDDGSRTYALVREASRTWLIRTDIQIQFLFDAGDKLVSYKMTDILTGP